MWLFPNKNLKTGDDITSSFYFMIISFIVIFSASEICAESVIPYSSHQTSGSISYELGASLYSHTISYDRVEFNLETKTASERLNTSSHRYTAKTIASSMNIENWRQQYLPLLNSLPINIRGKSLTISINDSETEFFIATDKEQALLSISGDVIWKHDIADIISEAVISKNGQHLIVRYENNIINWLDYKTGKTNYSLYIDPESLDWLIWTPEGYYDSSAPEFEPLYIENSYANYSNFSQLRYYLFHPSLITKIISGEILEPLKLTLNSNNSSAPTIIPLDEQNDSTDLELTYCIKANTKSSMLVLFSINDTVIQRKTISPSDSVINKQCSHIATFIKPKFISDYKLSAQTYDLGSNLWSIRYEQDISDNISTKAQAKPKLILISDSSNKLKNKHNQASIINYFNNTSFISIDLSPKEKNQTKTTVASKDTPFVMYLSSMCQIKDNDIIFTQANNIKDPMTLSRLRNNLQATKNPQSIIYLDCHVTEEINPNISKKLIHDFMYETGRTLLAQFSNRKVFKESGLKQSYMMTTLAKATQGEADKNDDLIIDSNELMEYMVSALPETTFEGSGDYGIIYSQIRAKNVFNLPIVLAE